MLFSLNSYLSLSFSFTGGWFMKMGIPQGGIRLRRMGMPP
jgi:hypothetical protein